MDPEILEALKALGVEFEKAGGWSSLVAVIGAVMGVIRIWRLPKVQGLIGRVLDAIGGKLPNVAAKLRWLLWDSLPDPVKWMVQAGLSALAGVTAALTGAVSWPMAAVGIVVATVGAWLGHGTTKVAGQALNGVLVKIPLYQGSGVQTAVSVVLPTGEPKP